MITNMTRPLSRKIIADMTMVIDTTIFYGIGAITFWLRHDDLEFSMLQGSFFAAAPLIAIALFRLNGVYNQLRLFDPLHALRSVLVGGIMALFIVVLIGFLTKTGQDISRIWIASWAGFSFLAVIATRTLAGIYFRRHSLEPHFLRQSVLIGTPKYLDILEQKIRSTFAHEIAINQMIKIKSGKNGSIDLQDALESLQTSEWLDNLDVIVIAIPGTKPKLIEQCVDALKHLDVNIDLCAEQGFLDFSFYGARSFAGFPVLRVLNRPLSGWDWLIKWLEDKILATLFILLCSPVLALIAILIKLSSSGPLIFKQKRYGFANEVITIYKFRTLLWQPEPTEVTHVTKGDPRVTVVGKILRRFSLDELPQLFNVLTGSMSLVGPRPHAVEHGEYYETLVDGYISRHRIKPGITGWAQINGFRGEITELSEMKKRVEHDLYYLENWSLWFDLFILLVTFPKILFDRKAY